MERANLISLKTFEMERRGWKEPISEMTVVNHERSSKIVRYLACRGAMIFTMASLSLPFFKVGCLRQRFCQTSAVADYWSRKYQITLSVLNSLGLQQNADVSRLTIRDRDIG